MNQLTEEQRQQLVAAALQARQQAYAVYSNFPVGAAVLTEDGKIFSGCNIENTSFGLTICAERTAIFAAVAVGERQFAGLALATEGGCSPCGACRQVIAEFSDDLPILIVDADPDVEVQRTSLAELLPNRFRRK